MRRCLLLLVVLGIAVPAAAQPGLPASIAEALAQGDSSRAHEAIRGALPRDPDNAALHRARLALELAGVGVRRLPRVLRQQQHVDGARALLRLAPSDTLSLRVLVADAVWTVLSTHDRVTPTATQSALSDATFVSRQEIEARLGRSRFDIDARRALAWDLDASGPARKARRDAAAWLETWRAAAPGDPRPAAAAVALATLATDWPAVLGAAEALRAARPDLPDASLYAGLAHDRLGDAAEAEADFARALAAMTPDRRARYEDVTPLLTPTQRAAYDADPEAFTATFWVSLDPRRLSDANERRTEHVARVVEADLLFGLTLENRFEAAPARRGAETEQGRLWVRYGRPVRTTRFSPNDDGIDAYGDSRFAVWDYDGFRFVFDDPDRDGAYRTYSPSAAALGRSPRAILDDFVLQDRAMQRDDPQRTQVAPALAIPVLASRFRRDDGATEVVLAFGVPLGDGPPARAETGVFGLRDGVVVTEQREAVTAFPSGRRLSSEDGGTVAAGAFTVALPDAPAAVRAEVAAGPAWGGTTVALDPLVSSGFGLSDLLLAVSLEDGGPVARGEVRLTPAPRAVFRRTDPIGVLVEAYGLGTRGGRTDVAVEASLTPLGGRRVLGLFGRRRSAGVAVAFDAQGDRPTETFSAVVDASAQPAGRYMLTVAVTDRTTGATASASREVVLE